jgi:FkbM family methyltransferase
MNNQSGIKKLHDLNEEDEKAEIRKYFNNKKNGVCVEVGSNEPVSVCSQSWHFEEKLNWKCILIEPNPDLVIKTKNNRPKAIIHECACVSNDKVGYMELHIPLSSQGNELTGHASLEKNADEHNYKIHKSIKVKTETLTNVLRCDDIDNIDFLSIDVEGTELEVLKGLDFDKYQPKLILLEDKHLYLNKHLYLKKKGFVLVRRLNRNCWYIPNHAHRPNVKLKEKIKLLKRVYLSIWFNKLKYALEHKTIQPFQTL